jgi:glutamate-1-semialdehyde 2,1-aminomutase
MPLLRFEDDADWRRGSAFCAAALRAGAYFHPKHNLFPYCPHTPADIDLALQSEEEGFAAVVRMG